MSHLFYIVGASGSGKDSILKAYRNYSVNNKLPIVIAHRYITRENSAENQKNENFISLSTDEFEWRKDHDFFSLSWNANNCSYGIGREIESWLLSGLSVVVNGSREYISILKNEIIKSKKINLVIIEIVVPEEILLQRLQYRKRETNTEIDQRMKRNKTLDYKINVDRTVQNVGSLENVVKAFANVIDEIT